MGLFPCCDYIITYGYIYLVNLYMDTYIEMCYNIATMGREAFKCRVSGKSGGIHASVRGSAKSNG